MSREMALKGYRVLMLERGGRAPLTGAAPTVAMALQKLGLTRTVQGHSVVFAHRLAGHLHEQLVTRRASSSNGQ